ncbi:MAG: LysM peptidoglycan-binding domain-containing protein [Armatimonadetes bacterium]|nr:LysM peptidoglycan-binding domain-containing protein [Armatimonadota bacterium]
MRLSGRLSLSRALLFGISLWFVFSFPHHASAAVHTVSSGESLYLISQWYGSSPEAIQRANGLTGDLIYPGQKLYIPPNPGGANSSAYTVRPGDTLYLIGSYFGVSYSDIMLANGLTSTMIYPGQRLVIPASPAGSGGTGPGQVSRGGVLPGRVPYVRSDFDLLARLITAEADSESFLTKVAVGAVVLNRVLSPLFPDTIPEVIYQVDEVGAYQFEPVLNGWINVPPSEEARRAAQAALNGLDPTNGALFFFESWVPNSFLQSRPLSMILDSFTFTY